MASAPAKSQRESRVAFTYPDFRFFELARLSSILGWQMQSVAVGWQVYNLTHNTMHLGYIGLVQFFPNIAFSLITGQVADRFDRRRVVQICQAVLILCSVALAALTINGLHEQQIGWVFAILFLIGTGQAFLNPASGSLLPMIVAPEHFSNAVSWNSSVWQLATIVGPSVGGLLYGVFGDSEAGVAHGAAAVYGVAAVLTILAFYFVQRMEIRSGRMERKAVSVDTVLAGVRYVYSQKVILGCISLDLFAVLLGGAVALLPVYAKDILHAGAFELGLLRGAPAFGACVQAIASAHMPPMKKAGRTMLWAVAGFGIATVIFGYSTNFYLSMACLVALGAFDMISVIVRHTVVQVLTPNAMQGRVNAVNMVFIGASNELGEFESGLTATLFGSAQAAVVAGGMGTIVIVILWALLFPAMREIKRLDQLKAIDLEQAQGGEII